MFMCKWFQLTSHLPILLIINFIIYYTCMVCICVCISVKYIATSSVLHEMQMMKLANMQIDDNLLTFLDTSIILSICCAVIIINFSYLWYLVCISHICYIRKQFVCYVHTYVYSHDLYPVLIIQDKSIQATVDHLTQLPSTIQTNLLHYTGLPSFTEGVWFIMCTFVCVCVCVCISVYVCVCVCVVCMNVCVLCVRVFVCVVCVFMCV